MSGDRCSDAQNWQIWPRATPATTKHSRDPIKRSARLRTIVHSPVPTVSSPGARRHPSAGSPAWLSSPTSSWPCCGQSERCKSPGQPCFVRLPVPSVLNRITSAGARAAIRLPVTLLLAVSRPGTQRRRATSSPLTENTDPANGPERCGDGCSPPTGHLGGRESWPLACSTSRSIPLVRRARPETIRAARCQLSTATPTVRSRSDDHAEPPGQTPDLAP